MPMAKTPRPSYRVDPSEFSEAQLTPSSHTANQLSQAASKLQENPKKSASSLSFDSTMAGDSQASNAEHDKEKKKTKKRKGLANAPMVEIPLPDVTPRVLWPNVGAYKQTFPFRLVPLVEDMMDHSFDYGAPRLMRDCHRILMEQGNTTLNAAPTPQSELLAAEFMAAQQLESTNVPEAMLAGLRDCPTADICRIFDVGQKRLYVSDRSLALLLLKTLIKFCSFNKNVEEFATIFFKNATNETAMRARNLMTVSEQEEAIICLNKTIAEYQTNDPMRSPAASNCHVALMFEFAYWAAELRAHTLGMGLHEHLHSITFIDDQKIDFTYLYYLFDDLSNKHKPSGREGYNLSNATKLLLFLSRHQLHVDTWGDEHKRNFTKLQPRFFNILAILYRDLKDVGGLAKPAVFQESDREYQLLHRLVLFSKMGCDMQPFFYYNSMSAFPKQSELPQALNQTLYRPDVVNYLLYYYSKYCHLTNPTQGVMPPVVRNWITRGQFRRRDGAIDVVPIKQLTWGMESSKTIYRVAQNLSVVVKLIREMLSRASADTNVKTVDYAFVAINTTKPDVALLKEQLIQFFAPILFGAAEQIQRQFLDTLIERYGELVPKREGLSIRGPYQPAMKDIKYPDVVELEE